MIKKIIMMLCLLTTPTLSNNDTVKSYQKGVASFYTIKTGTQTASGEKLNDNLYTAAHKSLPFGTKVKVICLQTGKNVVVKINDRGPFIKGRVIDLSKAAAQEIGLIKKGITTVEIFVYKN